MSEALVGQTVYVGMYTISIDGIETEMTKGIHASKEGAEAALAELRGSPMWEKQGLESWVDEDTIEP